MKTIFLIIILLAGLRAFAANDPLSDEALAHIQFDQKIGAKISPELIFCDETGRPVRLGDLFGEKPIVLILGYYGCPMLCTLVLNSAIETFKDLKWEVGRQFDVVFVSIDPKEKPELAADKRKTCLLTYGHRGDEKGWRFLTGDQSAIQTLADEIGFRFAFDPGVKQFAHPSGFVVLTPSGQIARYFLGINYSATELNSALRDAAANKTGTPADPVFMLCFHYSPLTGKYGNLVMDVVRGGGIVAVVAVMGVIFFTQQNHRKPGKSK